MCDLLHEEWRPVVGHPSYEVSSLGRVRSCDKVVELSNGQQRRYRGKVLRFGSSGKNGYAQFNTNETGVRETVRVHVAVAEAFIGPRPDGALVLHKDGNPANCRVDNLYYGSPARNTLDRVEHGRDFNGDRHPGRKLSSEDVAEIRDSVDCGHTHYSVAKRFGVARTTVSAIVSGRSWRNMPE